MTDPIQINVTRGAAPATAGIVQLDGFAAGYGGITIRELFALTVMHAMLSKVGYGYPATVFASRAIEHADALLAALAGPIAATEPERVIPPAPAATQV